MYASEREAAARPRVLVTGGTGYVGAAFCAHLARLGYHVTSYDAVPQRPSSSINHVIGDVADGLRLREVIEDRSISAVVHAAAMADLQVAATNPVAATRANVFGTAQVVEAARQTKVQRFVLVSSESVYGNVESSLCMTENQGFAPITTYGATKGAAELLVQSYCASGAFEGVSVRLAEVYGPDITMPESVFDMVAAGVMEVPFTAEAPASQSINLVHVDDVVDVLRLALETPVISQPAYHISDGQRHTLGSVADSVRRLLPAAAINFPTVPARRRLSQPPWCLDAVEADLGFRPRWQLSEAIPSLIASARASREAAA